MIATGVSAFPFAMNISIIASSLLIAIKITTVADDWAASFISLEISPDWVVPVVTQKLSLTPLQVRGIICEAGTATVSYTHLRAHETDSYLVCRLLLDKK